MKARQQPQPGTKLDAADFEQGAMHGTEGAGATSTAESSALELSDTDIENLLSLENKGACSFCKGPMDKRTESLLETLQVRTRRASSPQGF